MRLLARQQKQPRQQGQQEAAGEADEQREAATNGCTTFGLTDRQFIFRPTHGYHHDVVSRRSAFYGAPAGGRAANGSQVGRAVGLHHPRAAHPPHASLTVWACGKESQVASAHPLGV